MGCSKECCSCGGKYCAKKVSIFSVLQENQLKEITDTVIRRTYKKGQSLFFEKDMLDKLYIINEGKIKVFKYTKEGKEQILYVLSEGDILGDLNLLKKGVAQFNAEALEDTKVCIFTKEDFDKTLKGNNEIMFKILENVHDRIVNLENLVQRLSTKDVESRIADVLVSFVKDFGKVTEDGVEITLPLGREDLANYAGVTRETISRKLSSLQEEGLIELIGNKVIVIKDLETLKEL